MTTATAPQRQPQTATQEPPRQDDDFARLMSKNARIGSLYKTLQAGEQNIEAMLPDFMKGQADRLIRRACITFSKTPDLDGITDEHFRRCVIEAAEMGFAIDGKLCYVVKYKNHYQLQLDYKAMIAVAKRNRTIKDIDADVVCANDHFKHGKNGGQSVLEHTFDLSQPRGEVTGAYCRVFLPDGSGNYEVMTRQQLDGIQRRAPAQNGPWKTDPDEMRKKSVIRRKLKLYQDDPGLMRMLEITAWEDESDEAPPPATLDDLTARLMARSVTPKDTGNGHGLAAGELPLDTPDEPPEQAPAPDDDLTSLVRMDLADAASVSDVEAIKSTLLRKYPAAEALIRGMAGEREQAIRDAKGKKA